MDGAPTYKIHTQETPIFFHNFSFLPEHADSHHHAHTLNAGLHSFPFSLMLPSDLPASLRSHAGAAMIEYRLKATVVKSGFVTTNWTSKRVVNVHRGLGADSVEFNSTVELGMCLHYLLKSSIQILKKIHGLTKSSTRLLYHTKYDQEVS